LLVSFLVVIAVEAFSSVVHPVPEGFGGTREEMHQHVERIPPWVLAVGVAGWAFGAFAATWTAQKIGNFYSAAIVGLLLLTAVVFNISMLPYPVWFKIVILLAIPTALVAGSRLAMGRKATATVVAT
jgi:hypothetical protein